MANIRRVDNDFLLQGHHQYLRHISVDLVIFGFHENQLKVLLMQWQDGPWCLPGGFIKKEESLEASATRTLFERTGLKNIFLQQFKVFGDPNREKGKRRNPLFKNTWLYDRFITVGHYALVEFSKVKPRPDMFSESCKWWDIHEVPELLYDHHQILTEALAALRLHLHHHPIGVNLLPEKFTMPELQRLYETILNRKVDRRNFQKKILSLKILTRLRERKTGGAHKAPFLYKFNQAVYKKALEEGLASGF